MRCPKCGKKIKKGSRWCLNCGYDLTPDDYQKNRQKKKIRRLVVLCVALIAALVVCVLTYFGYVDIPLVRKGLVNVGIVPHQNREEAEAELESNLNDYIDTDEYYAENATVINKIDAATSENNLSEAAVTELLSERGFDVSTDSISSTYDQDGTYNETSVGNTSTIHPSYVMYYITDDEQIWTITVTNGQITAYPVSYNLTSNDTGVEVIIAETENLYTYDSAQNAFYDCVPNADALTVKTVDQITAESLENFAW